MLKDEDIKVEKDCTHLVPPDSVIDEGYAEILSEVMDISVDTPAETLRTLELNVVQRQMDLAPHAGNAFLIDDKEFMNFLKGQYIALEALRKFISDKYLRLLVEQEEKEEKKKWKYECVNGHKFDQASIAVGEPKYRCPECNVGTMRFIEDKHYSAALAVEQDAKEEKESYAAYYKEKLETLLPHDHHLFDDLVKGLVKEGWTEEGGSTIFRLLNKQGAAIKLFRHAESPQVIKVCFSAEPEREDEDVPQVIEFIKDEVKEYLDGCISFWRDNGTEESKYYIDAYQSVRISLFGATKPSDNMDRKSGNKWSMNDCSRCGEKHTGYSGKLDAKGIEYVVCGVTHKRMDVDGQPAGHPDLFAAKWTKI